MEGPCPHFHVIGLQDDAALIAPIAMQGEDQVLEAEAHSCGFPYRNDFAGLWRINGAAASAARFCKVMLTLCQDYLTLSRIADTLSA
jgi:hypothetical protein